MTRRRKVDVCSPSFFFSREKVLVGFCIYPGVGGIAGRLRLASAQAVERSPLVYDVCLWFLFWGGLCEAELQSFTIYLSIFCFLWISLVWMEWVGTAGIVLLVFWLDLLVESLIASNENCNRRLVVRSESFFVLFVLWDPWVG